MPEDSALGQGMAQVSSQDPSPANCGIAQPTGRNGLHGVSTDGIYSVHPTQGQDVEHLMWAEELRIQSSLDNYNKSTNRRENTEGNNCKEHDCV